MPPRRAKSKPPLAPPRALEKSLRRVLREHSAGREELAPDTVHDLRVALRRCRSLAEGFGEIDGHRAWRKLSKAAKRLQRGLAGIRDHQVMSHWVRSFNMAGGVSLPPAAATTLAKMTLATFPLNCW